MEALLFLGALILVIVGSALIMSVYDLIGWIIGRVLGIKIGDDGDT